MMRRLPPLTAIEAFVHVARLGSIKAAAEELSLSSPALSRRVQALERFVARPLFERRHQAMVLNAGGEALLARLAPALDALGTAISESMGSANELRIRLNLLPLWASQQLMPRLDDLRETHPELHIDVDTAPHGLSRLGEGIDAAIVLARELDPILYARRLDRNKMVAIASRAVAADIAQPSDIARRTILVHRDMPDLFEVWKEGVGLPHLEPAAIDHFDSGPLMLEAAAHGVGVAMMLDEHLAHAGNPELVAVGEPIESSYSYWFACRRSALSRRPVRMFHDWLVEAVRHPA